MAGNDSTPPKRVWGGARDPIVGACENGGTGSALSRDACTLFSLLTTPQQIVIIHRCQGLLGNDDNLLCISSFQASENRRGDSLNRPD